MPTDWENIDWEDSTPSWVQRPTEEAAFAALRLMAQVSSAGGYTDILSPLENQVHQLEIAVKRTHPALRTRYARAEYISQTYPELHAGPWQISSILDEVENLMRDFEQYRLFEELEHAESQIAAVEATRINDGDWREIVVEALREEAGKPVQMPLWMPLAAVM